MSALIEQITPEVLAQMSAQEKRELILLLEALDLPKLARIKPAPENHDNTYSQELSEVLDAARRHREKMTPEELAAEEAQDAIDEEELLVWREGRGKNAELPPFVEARCRLARHRREQRNAAKEDLDEWREAQRRRADQAMAPRPATDYMRDMPRPQRVDAPIAPEAIPGPQPTAQAKREHADYVDLPLTERAAARLRPRKDETVLESIGGIDRRERAWREHHAVGDGEWRN